MRRGAYLSRNFLSFLLSIRGTERNGFCFADFFPIPISVRVSFRNATRGKISPGKINILLLAPVKFLPSQLIGNFQHIIEATVRGGDVCVCVCVGVLVWCARFHYFLLGNAEGTAMALLHNFPHNFSCASRETSLR